MNYTIESISDIDNLDFKFDTSVRIKYSTEEFDYNLLVYNKKNYNNLVVLSNGAIDLNKKRPPVFSRSTWKDDIEASLIYLDDGTIHNTNLSLGWGQGNNKEFVLEIYSKIIRLITKKLTISDEEVYYFGSSAGGFMSMILSSMHLSSHAIVNNPQTDIGNYHEGHSVPLLNLSYGSVSEAYSSFKDRVCVVDAFKSNEFVPYVYYIQNQYSAHDLKYHVNPFVKSMKQENLPIEKIIFINYFNKEKGHNPIDEGSTLNYLNLLIQKNIF